MAARVCDPLAGRDGSALLFGKLRISVGPVIGSAVCGGCVDHADVRILDQGDSLNGACVRKAEEYDVGVVQEFLTLVQIMTLFFLDPEKGEILSLSDPLVDLESCGAGLSVDINLCLHSNSPCL